MRASLASRSGLHRRFFSLLHPPAPEPSLPDLIFLFSTNYFSTPPGGMLKQKNSFALSVWKSEWRREWDLNPRAPKGHRLTGEPIPDMGPRARQTARYQAPESRLNWATFHRLFSLLESAPEDTNSRNPVWETRARIAPKEEAWACFLRRLTRVAMGASQPTTLNGRMAVLAPGGRHP